MGLQWSDKKCKNDTLLVAKAPLTATNKDDVWLLNGIKKNNPQLAKAIKKDGLGVSKDTFGGHRWGVVWFHEITETTFDTVENEDGEEVYEWQKELSEIIYKWVTKISILKDTLAMDDSDDNGSSVEDPYYK